MFERETTHTERVAMIERHLAGESLQTIASALGRNYFTVRSIWRAYQQHGWTGIAPKPKGPPPVGRLGDFAPRIKYVLLRLKCLHPGWGVNLLLLEAQRRPSLAGLVLPKRSTVAAYLAPFGARLGRAHRAPTRRPPPPAAPTSAPHQCWQIDFKGDEVVDGQRLVVMPFMVCDAASGAPLAGIIHQVRAKGRRDHLTTRTVQADLRRVFSHWGLPDALRMDRDSIFVGSTRLEWPGLLLLWLIGLGVQPLINRAYRPTDNAIVERNHWSWEQHVVLGQTHHTLSSVQQATDQTFADRRHSLPSRHAGCNGQPFLVAFPALATPRRPYTPPDEARLFDTQRVAEYLAAWEWRRTVDSTGKIALANRNHLVGHSYRGQVVKVRFDPTERRLVCRLADEKVVAELDLPEATAAYLIGDDHMSSLQGGGST
jgi:transposase InsO family protein